MISGAVNDRLEPCLELSLRSSDGRRVSVTAVIDTAFNGDLTLPSQLISALGFPSVGPTGAVLADGSVAGVQTYRGQLFWQGKTRAIYVLATEDDPLIGTSMLRDHSLHIDMVPGGKVTIRSRRGRE